MARLALPVLRIRNGKPYRPVFTRSRAMRLAEQCFGASSLQEAASLVRRAAKRCPPKSAWNLILRRLARGLKAGRAAFQVFYEGNSKLPFVSFSALPVVGCPGAGECAKYCYSLRAWRYPAPFARQLQNSLLLRFAPEVIASAFKALPEGITLRLYVDGDFDSANAVAFWFNALKARPDIQAYGYSKSWDLLAEYGQREAYPANYVLNISNGGAPQKTGKAEMLALPITRGEFISLPIHYRPVGVTGNIGFKRYADADYHRAVRAAGAAAGRKVFSCPGNCGECTGIGHACGSMKLKGVTIAIGIH